MENYTIQSLLKEKANSYHQELIDIRRHLHQHPELSYEEKETAAFISKKLQEYGITFQEGVAGYGILGKIEGINPEKGVLSLRADMDALPIQEANEVPYKSKFAGKMHACGHDCHSTMLLGAAKLLNETKHLWEGSIELIFQPAEEKLPGGASLMLASGAMDKESDTIVGQHIFPLLEVGKVGFRSGMYMASADEIYIKVKGKGGHAAMPEMCIDPVIAAANMLVALQQVISRKASPKVPSVLSFGKIEAKGATNIIPNEVYIEGTFRTMNEKWRSEAHLWIEKIAKQTVEGFGATAEVDIKKGYPFLYNHPELTAKAKEAAIEFLGAENVVDLDLYMASEDFSYYTQERAGCFYRLGTRNEAKGIVSGVHTPTFDIDEQALNHGTALFAYIAIKLLTEKINR